MEIFETDGTGVRIVALEKKIRDMEALAKGLIEETIDLKSTIIMITKEADEYSRMELRRSPAIRETASPASASSPFMSAVASPDGSTVVRQKCACQADAPVTPAAPLMALIMQPDGTMKMEPRRGDRNQTDSSVRIPISLRTKSSLFNWIPGFPCPGSDATR